LAGPPSPSGQSRALVREGQYQARIVRASQERAREAKGQGSPFGTERALATPQGMPDHKETAMNNSASMLLKSPSQDELRSTPPEEELVRDARAGLTPSQFVERKLVSLLRTVSLPVSHLRLARPTRR
jgi:hypothetical protein